MKAKIEQALSRYISGPPQPVFDFDMRDIAADLQALPLMFDMGGCYALLSNGKIVSFDWDNTHEHREESDARVIRMALFQGSLRHKELEELRPVRPSEGEDCQQCKSRGVISSVPPFDAFVCHCGGLGWVLPGE